MVVCYSVWLSGSLGLASFSTNIIWAAIASGVLLNGVVLVKNKFIREGIRDRWPVWLAEEGLFFLALAVWANIRGFQPDIEGLEKYMDFGFVNSILRGSSFPPADMWLAGESINYYYFGHLMSAVVTKISGLAAAVTYNLMIATIFALAFSAAFCLGGNLAARGEKKIKTTWRLFGAGGLITAILLNLGGNLQPMYYWLKNQSFAGYWYPDATRFIIDKFGAADNTIHEFPIYSYVVADLHGHLLDLPVVLFFLALIYLWTANRGKKSRWLPLITALALAVMYMTNMWDFAIYFLLLAMVTLGQMFVQYGLVRNTITKSVLRLGPILLLSILFVLPFQLNFKSIASGVALTDYHSPLWMLVVLWGWPLFFSLVLAGLLIMKRKSLAGWLTGKRLYLVGLVLVSWLLIILPEIIYVKDIYIHSYQRANTVFKFTYQSFVMFAIAGSYMLVKIIPEIKNKLVLWLVYGASLVMLTFILIYPRQAVKSYYGLTDYRGLNGVAYLQKKSPGDYGAISWLNKISGQPVIVEAVGESYTEYARISANTGLPTVLGWRVHEWLWRGSFDEPGKRTEEVRQIYESPSFEETKNILDEFGVKYVIVGALERKAYPALNADKFNQLGRPVFSEKGTTIYEIN